MLTRVALFAASLAASAVLAIGLALFGLGPAAQTAGPAVVTPVAATDAAPPPVTEIDTTYVVPTATPDPTPSPIVIQRIVTSHGDGEGESGDND